MLPFGNAIKHSPKGAPIVVSVNERDLVRRYHDQLFAHGVARYSWDRCWDGYRRSVAEQILPPHASPADTAAG